ncbi:hypothetical protein VTP01DRAFT_4211 [Rhizomucor pusillus]|uniref:uncharacterized protein n=1 Tax=Rhizomucor pusillus TaxID=4840 RepID=UPI003742796C
MAFLQTDIDPLYLRERHLKLCKSNSSLGSSSDCIELEEQEKIVTSNRQHESGFRRWFSKAVAPMEAVDRPLQSVRPKTCDKLDRLVSFHL